MRRLVAILALVIAGCSSNGDTDSQANHPPSSPTTLQTAPESSAAAAVLQSERAGTATAPTTAPPSTEPSQPVEPVGPPSQSEADADRDGIIPELAVLPLASRADPLVSAEAEEGTWVLSKLGREVIDASLDEDGCGLGNFDGEYPSEVICTMEYGEVLLTNETGILKAYPMPGAIPRWIHVAPTFIYFGAPGDGGLPHSTLGRIDRESLRAEVVLIPTGLEEIDPELWLRDWNIVGKDQVATYETLVGSGPEREGTPTDSSIGALVVDLPGIDEFIDASR